LSACQWPGDADPSTQHYGLKIDDQIVGIGSLYLANHDCAPGANVWQLRGMAVHPQHRGANLGRQLLTHMIGDARDRLNAKSIWCNARLRATTLYERAGFEFASEPFEIAGVGPHRIMRLLLA
jgi:predicted GNAT family N-acyltransferase